MQQKGVDSCAQANPAENGITDIIFERKLQCAIGVMVCNLNSLPICQLPEKCHTLTEDDMISHCHRQLSYKF
jgi:hypothetical protein